MNVYNTSCLHFTLVRGRSNVDGSAHKKIYVKLLVQLDQADMNIWTTLNSKLRSIKK